MFVVCPFSAAEFWCTCTRRHGWPFWLGTLLTHIQVANSQDPQIPFHRIAFQCPTPQFLCISRVTASQVQNLALSFVNHIVGDCPAI